MKPVSSTDGYRYHTPFELICQFSGLTRESIFFLLDYPIKHALDSDRGSGNDMNY